MAGSKDRYTDVAVLSHDDLVTLAARIVEDARSSLDLRHDVNPDEEADALLTGVPVRTRCGRLVSSERPLRSEGRACEACCYLYDFGGWIE